MPEEKRATDLLPVVSEGAKTRKRSEASKFAKLFLADDISSTKDYVVDEILVPKAKDLISTFFKSVIDSLLYGRGGGYSGGQPVRTSTFSYQDYYSSPIGQTRAYSGARSSDPMFDEILFPTYASATEACARMDEIISRFGVATVGNLFELANIKVPYTAERWGWSDFSSARVTRVNGGFVIKTPRIMPID